MRRHDAHEHGGRRRHRRRDGPVATHKLNGVWGSGPSDVWVVGDGGTILRNQGSGFEPVVSGTQADLNDVWGVSATEVYFVGDGVALVYDGTSVKPAFTPTNFNGKAVNLWRIGGVGSNAWTGGSDGAVFKLASGGSWRSQIPYESQGLTFTDAWAADATTAYVVLGGLAAGVWKHDASGFNQVVMPTETLTA
ncbi:MAG: hypothetical protein KC503_43635, partial [Myxococcales bacterium]|nr:hypothetical protein [Myxococcales bacterium]